MQLGRLCKYAKECPVYLDKNERLKKPVFLIKNVFCNRDYKGWNNCKRYILLEQGEEVDYKILPND